MRTTHVLYYTKLQMLLHKTTDHITQNYTIHAYTTDKLPANATDTNQVNGTQIQHNDVAIYNLQE